MSLQRTVLQRQSPFVAQSPTLQLPAGHICSTPVPGSIDFVQRIPSRQAFVNPVEERMIEARKRFMRQMEHQQPLGTGTLDQSPSMSTVVAPDPIFVQNVNAMVQELTLEIEHRRTNIQLTLPSLRTRLRKSYDALLVFVQSLPTRVYDMSRADFLSVLQRAFEEVDRQPRKAIDT